MFFHEKSLKVSFSQVNISLYIWYLTIYKNDTFQKKAREVSSKYHKIGRSIIKNRQASYKTSETAYKTSEISNEMHQLCPRTWLLIPTYMGTDDHVRGYEWPKRGVSMPKALGNNAPHSWTQMPKGLGKSGHTKTGFFVIMFALEIQYSCEEVVWLHWGWAYESWS